MSTTLQENLERYLKREGLYDIIPEHRRRTLFTVPLVLMWAVGLWGPAFYFLLRQQGLRGLIVAIFGPLALFVITFLVLAVVFGVRQVRSGKKLSTADAGTIGGIFLLYFPLLMTVALGIYLGSWLAAITYIGTYIAIMAIVLLLQMQAYRVHLVVELLRSVFRALWRSIALLLVLIPLLLVVTLLSVFSQELWQALGTLSAPRLVGSILCLVAPVLILILGSLDRETTSIVGELPRTDQIVRDAQATPYVKERLQKGFISEEEWNRLISQLEWLGPIKLAQELHPMLRRKIKRWLAFLLALTSLALVVSFFVYFCGFFSVLLTPSLVEMWTDVELATSVVPLRLSEYYLPVTLSTTAVAIAKVALVLAVFVAVTSSVYALTDESTKGIFTEWLRQKANSWRAVSSLYLCVVSPNYQIWEYRVRDKKEGRVHVFIVVPKGSPQDFVEEACEHMASHLEEYKHLVIVTAFEENPGKPVYELGMPGNRWRLLHNKSKNIRVFEAIPLVLEELRYQHFLGRDSLDDGTEIPDDWFGDTPEGIKLAKNVWKEDSSHEWVLHPYVFRSDTLLSLEICLAKRMSTSDQYRQYIQRLLALTRKTIPDAQNIWVELTFRDTLDTLARVHWSETLPYVDYRDEMIGENRVEKPEVWDWPES
jgi:uncharacterized membrane protein